jgi:hypothetical protein
MGHQCPAARLAARVGTQLLGDWGELHVERVDRRDRDRDLLARGLWRGLSGQPLAPLGRHQLAARRQPVVVEHRLDALLPLAALLAQGVAQADPGAQIEQVDPAGSMTPAPARSSTAPAGAGRPRDRTWRAPSARAAHWSRPARPDAPRTDRAQLLDHEPPARRGPQRHLELAAAETLQKPPDRLAMRRRHPRPAHLTGRGVDPLGSDLPSMLIKSHYDRHTGPPQAPRLKRPRGLAPLELRSPAHAIFRERDARTTIRLPVLVVERQRLFASTTRAPAAVAQGAGARRPGAQDVSGPRPGRQARAQQIRDRFEDDGEQEATQVVSGAPRRSSRRPGSPP